MSELRAGVESEKDFDNSARRWISEIELAEKAHKKFWKQGDRIWKKYKDDRASDDPFMGSGLRFNVLWSNVQTMKPAIYAQTPKPQVERRFKSKDQLARVAAEILERALIFSCDTYEFAGVANKLILDYLLPGRAQVWVRYVPHMTQGIDELGLPFDQVAYEEAIAEHLNWRDYLEDPGARSEEEIRWKARKVYLTKDALKKRFGAEIAEKVPLDFSPHGDDAKDVEEYEQFKKACIYEIWDKESRKVYWISKGYSSKPLDVIDDPLRLSGFFPCPRALCATTDNNSTIPIADYVLYQDLAEALDEILDRAYALSKTIKVTGVYAQECDGIQRLLNEGVENQLLPIENWPLFAQSGGLRGAVDFLPIQDNIVVLRELYQIAETILGKIYEKTGISDIIRGHTSPQETATAQQMKGQFATLRLSQRQAEVQRFFRDIIRIKGEIIAEHFQPETLAAMIGIDSMQDEVGQLFMPALQVLKDDAARAFKIEIETDSTLALDESQEKQDRTEFLNAFGNFMRMAAPVGAQMPELIPILGEMMLFGVRGFKAGRSLEGALEQAVDQAVQTQQQRIKQQQQGQQQNPEAQAKMLEVQIKAQAEQANMELAKQKAAADIQLQREKAGAEQMLKQQKLEGEFVLRKQKLDADILLDSVKANNEAQMQIYRANTSAADND